MNISFKKCLNFNFLYSKIMHKRRVYKLSKKQHLIHTKFNMHAKSIENVKLNSEIFEILIQ